MEPCWQDRAEAEHVFAPAVARSLPQPRVMSAVWRHHHRLHQRVAGTEGRAGWRRFLRPRLPGCALPILARDGYGGIPEVAGPEGCRRRIHLLWSTGAEYLCDAWDLRRL